MRYFDECNGLGKLLLRAFAASLDIEPDYFIRAFEKPITRCSVIYYPPQPPAMGAEQFGVAPHSDFGTLTLLYQDNVGGLQVKDANGDWVTAHPIAGTYVVNVGDLLGALDEQPLCLDRASRDQQLRPGAALLRGFRGP